MCSGVAIVFRSKPHHHMKRSSARVRMTYPSRQQSGQRKDTIAGSLRLPPFILLTSDSTGSVLRDKTISRPSTAGSIHVQFVLLQFKSVPENTRRFLRVTSTGSGQREQLGQSRLTPRRVSLG